MSRFLVVYNILGTDYLASARIFTSREEANAFVASIFVPLNQKVRVVEATFKE